jgi:hypothetical protein
VAKNDVNAGLSFISTTGVLWSDIVPGQHQVVPMATESANIKRNRKPEDDSWSSEAAAPKEKKDAK